MATQSHTHTDLTHGSIPWHLCRMASPLVVGIMAIMSMYLVDTYYLGQLGKNPLAAMGFIFPVIGILNGIAFGLGAGASSVIARALGRKDSERVQHYTSQAIVLGFMIAFVLAAIGHLTISPLFKLMGAPQHLIPYISDYASIWYSGCFLVVVPMIGNSAIRAAGNTHIPSLIMITVAIVNVILDPILIFGLFGFPRLELQGAALATIIGYSVGFTMAIYILRYRLKLLVWHYCLENMLSGWRAILRIALPAIGNNLIVPLSVAIITWLVAKHGIEAVAGFNVAVRIEAFCIIPLMAMAAAIGPFVGQNLGANRVDRLGSGVHIAFIFTALWGLLSTIILLTTRSSLAQLFSQDPAITEVASDYLKIIPWSYAFLGWVMITASTATGMGSAMPALSLTLIRLVILYLPIALIAGNIWGVNGIFAAACAANGITGIIALFWLRLKLASKQY